ncbi:MAG: methionine--tRNA ligase [Candidatus Parcubacteria bacterium]|nr:methionine--tRNA ligase [Candidatus Parcubacteria bacterium]
MTKENKKFYISTALPYVNSVPHIGFALEIIQADVIARYHRNLGEEVFFLTGTDENGLKIARAAEEANIPVEEFAKKNADTFRNLKEILNLSFDDFIRTTEDRHIKAVYKLWQACKKDVYKKKYRGLYCVGCEQFYTEDELVDGLCPEHKTKPEIVEEENYFFKLSAYENQLKELIEKDVIKVIPQTRKNEVLGFIKKGLEDICISRSSERARNWGIPIQDDPSQIFWSWFDAVINYISALGYGTDDNNFKKYWQENDNKIHAIGKGILIFHSLYWPAYLLSAGISLPDKLFVHGYVTAGGQKMSKSLGNIVNPSELVKKYGTDAVRYFFLREASPFEDSDFTIEKFEDRYNSDLAKGLGNLVARVVTLAIKCKTKNEKCKTTIQNVRLKEEIIKIQEDYKKTLEEFKFNEALKAVWELIGFCDRYIEQEKPWEDTENKTEILNDLLLTIDEIAKLIEPFLPETSEKISQQIKSLKSIPLFPRI